MSNPTTEPGGRKPPQSADEAEVLSQQARESRSAGRGEEAVALYERALALDPKRLNDWINRGLALWSLHRNEEALECYERAIALEPLSALAWMNRANVLHDMKRPAKEILASYDRAIEIDPELASAWYNKGDELAWMGNFTDAIRCFEKARDLGMSDADRLIRRCREIVMGDMNEIMP